MPEANDPWASLADSLGAVPAPDQASPQPPAAQPAPDRPRAAQTRRPEPKKPAPSGADADWSDIVSGLGLQPDPVPSRPAPPPRQSVPPAARQRAPLPPAESFDREPEPRPARERRADEERPGNELPPRARGGEPAPDSFGFQDRPIVDRGAAERPAAGGRRDDEGRREGGRSGGRGGRGDGRRGAAGERRSEDRPPAPRHEQPRQESSRAPGRDDGPPFAQERAAGEQDEAGGDGAPSDDRVRDGGEGIEGDLSSGEPRRGRRRRGRRGGRGRGGRERDDAPRGEGAVGRSEDAAAPRDDLDARDDDIGFEPRRPTGEDARQERRPPAPPRRQSDGDRRPVRGHDAEGPSQPPREDRPASDFDWDTPVDRPPQGRSQSDDRAPSRRPVRGEDDAWGGLDREPREPAGDTSDGGERSQTDGEPQGDSGDEQSGRRRRRRGRRGGRRRGGRERTGDERAPADQAPDDAAPLNRSDAAEEEPLPSGYGRAPVPPRPAPNGARGSEGETRGRRRRGRGDRKISTPRTGSSGTGSAPGETGTVGEGEAKTRGRSSRRGTAGRSRSPEPEIRSTSRLSRGRRDDFAPVAGGYDEDDEGLDFLGIEEAGREPALRTEARHSDDDEILAESGLASVTDVPSWVEAIGIVIAGNLDSRNRLPRGGDDHDRGRRDGAQGRN